MQAAEFRRNEVDPQQRRGDPKASEDTFPPPSSGGAPATAGAGVQYRDYTKRKSKAARAKARGKRHSGDECSSIRDHVDDEICAGTIMIVDGLRTRPELNGSPVVVLSPPSGEDPRVAIRVTTAFGHTDMRVKDVCLFPTT